MSVQVTPDLVLKHVANSPVLSRAYEALETDEEVQELVRMSNIVAVGRLKYNDHGVVHARIVSGAALELFDILVGAGVTPSTVADGTTASVDEAKLVVLLSAYLHDVGNSIHRVNHEALGALLVKDLLTRIISDVIPGVGRRRYLLRQEVIHGIYATETNVRALTVEAGVVKVADGTDMAEGRARIPYKLGRLDMHAMSATSIKKVFIGRGSSRPARIYVVMDDYAGLFQFEAVLKPKILTSGIEGYVEVYINVGGVERRAFPGG